MPLLDHFHPPLSEERHWESFHATWAATLADDLNRRLPEGYFAEEQAHAGARVEIDVGTFESQSPTHGAHSDGNALAMLPPQVWTPSIAPFTVPAHFADDFEVRVLSTHTGPTLVAAIELVSPRNKDRAEARRAFAIKCASYLYQGIGLIVVDVVSSRHANLHAEIMSLLGIGDPPHLPADTLLYAVAYQPLRRREREEIDLWPTRLALGAVMPALPLALDAERIMPVDLEATYMDARRRRRLG